MFIIFIKNGTAGCRKTVLSWSKRYIHTVSRIYERFAQTEMLTVRNLRPVRTFCICFRVVDCQSRSSTFAASLYLFALLFWVSVSYNEWLRYKSAVYRQGEAVCALWATRIVRSRRKNMELSCGIDWRWNQKMSRNTMKQRQRNFECNGSFIWSPRRIPFGSGGKECPSGEEEGSWGRRINT